LFLIGSSNAMVIFGGPSSGFAPSLTVPALAANQGPAGLGLNNSGGDMLLLRNAAGQLISRVVYTNVSTNGSLTRFPDLNGDFAPHSGTGAHLVSPGMRPDGRPHKEIAPAEISEVTIQVSLESNESVRLRWNAQQGRTYSVLESALVTGPFNPLAVGLDFPNPNGEYVSQIMAGVPTRFYRVTTP
jgi:hypothetical protein